MKIMFFLRSLNYGGTERQLVQLAKGLHHRGWPISVVLFYRGGAFQKELESAGVTIHSLKKRGRWDVIFFLVRLVALIRKEKPECIYSLLAVPNILSVLVKPFLPPVSIIWGFRVSNVDLVFYDWFIRASYWLEAFLSSFADLIIVNSKSGLAVAKEKGFAIGKMVFVPNGIDIEKFRPDPILRKMKRKQWEVDEQDILVGLVGRFDPMKDHSTFIYAAAITLRSRKDVHFLCIGEGDQAYKENLVLLVAELGIAENCKFLNVESNMPATWSALDIGCSSSSFGEGFSNVVAEAMACEVPCVVTDVGDSSCIVGNTGEVVPPKNPDALALGLKRLLARLDSQNSLKREARERIIQNFTSELLVERTIQAIERGLT